MPEEMNADLLGDGVAYADAWVAYQQERRDIPGVSVAIRHGDRTLLAKGYGAANLERATPMTPAHIFRIASHSKTFTATAIMQLLEAGKLRLDDPLADSIPWLRERGNLAAVTIRQALNHTTGIVRNGDDADYWQLSQPFPDRDELRRLVEEGGEVLPANTSFKYSNIAYALLGLVIEAASGMPYNEYVTRHIIAPLGLRDTGPDTGPEAPAMLATGYTARRFGFPHQPLPDAQTHALAAATGFYSTAEELSRYAAAHCFGETTLLSDASKREMQQPYWRVAQADSHYGLGFSVQEIEGRRYIGHGGGFPGHATHTLIDPTDRLVVVALTNLTSGPAAILTQGIVKIIRFALRQPPRETPPIPYERFTGRFVSLWGVTDVAAFGGSLVALHPDADDPVKMVERLAVEDEGTLRVTEAGGYGAPGEPVRYHRDAQGAVTKIIAGGTSAYPEAIYRARMMDAAHPNSR